MAPSLTHCRRLRALRASNPYRAADLWKLPAWYEIGGPPYSVRPRPPPRLAKRVGQPRHLLLLHHRRRRLRATRVGSGSFGLAGGDVRSFAGDRRQRRRHRAPCLAAGCSTSRAPAR